MPNEEIDALLGRFIREAGGRLTYLTEDKNGDIPYAGKKYRETAEITDVQAAIIESNPDLFSAIAILEQLTRGCRIVLIKK